MVLHYYILKNEILKPSGKFGKLPFVTIQLPVYNEKYVVERLINSSVNVSYPKSRFEVQVLDDSTDETTDIIAKIVNDLIEKGFNITHIRRGNRFGFKAGALQYGLEIAKGNFIAIFDADFLVPQNFIKDTIHYFTDPQIGMVQICWDYINRDYSAITEIQGVMLDGHFIVEHFARNRSGKFFNFNGTAGIWRKRAIIDAGGWQDDTLTEDLDLSYRAQIKGWKFLYLKDSKSLSELPVDINAFKQQQHRWAKGSIETFKKDFPLLLKEKLPLTVKLEALFHLGGNFSYILVLLLSLVMYPSIVSRLDIGWYQLLFTDIPLFVFSFFSIAIFYIVAEMERGSSFAKSILKIPMLMSVGIAMSINNSKAVLEALFNKKSSFERTPKFNITLKREKWFYKNYRVKNLSLPSVEFIMALYFGYIILFSVTRGNFFSVPLLLIFFVGFLYSSMLSFYHTLKKGS